MAREYPRSRRVEEQIQRILSDLIRTEVRDPRVRGVVITEVRVSRDLGVAWVYYSVLAADQQADPGLQAGLEHSAGFLRSRLARELSTRTVPDIRFRFDEAGERSRHLEQLIDHAVRRDTAAVADPDPREPGEDES
jgi:ribosome-binding factor A